MARRKAPKQFRVWSYDKASRITSFQQSDGTNTDRSSYTYDGTDQLTGADHSQQTDEAYAYDANGNRTNGFHQTGPNNRLPSDGTCDYAYDGEETAR